MKVSFFLTLISLNVSAVLHSQDVKLNVTVKDKSLIEVIRSIEKQSNYRFFFSDNYQDLNSLVSMNVQDKNISEVLTGLLDKKAITYRILENNIVVITPIDNANVAQQQKITGTITDSNTGETLPGVSIQAEGTTIGIISDASGKYSIEVPSQSGALVFSYVGYLAQRVAISGQTVIDIKLVVDAQKLDEIVVIGYGSVKKKELTGAVTTVKEKEFNQGSITNPFELLQGKVAGLSVVRANGGDPTSGLEIRIRGASSFYANQDPLVILDGVAVGALNSISISPQDIESIDVLKDGSASAIYGTRGNSGVILITTKHGNKGSMQVEFSSRYSTESILKKTEVLSGDEYREMKSKYLASSIPQQNTIGQSMQDLGYSTDWFNQIVRRPFSQNQYLAIGGGNNKSSYHASFNYIDQQGIMITSGNKDYKLNLNASQFALNDILKFDLQLGYDTYLQHPVDYDAIRQAEQFNPTAPVHNPDGTFYELYNSWQYMNPVGMLTQRTRDNSGSRTFGDLGVTINLPYSFKINAIGGMQINGISNGYYEPSYSYPQVSAGTNGYAQRVESNSNIKTFESTVSWTKHTVVHSIDIIGGYSFMENVRDSLSVSNKNFISNDVLYNALQLGDISSKGNMTEYSYKEKSNLVSFFARAIYNFRGKYFLSASVRREGSSKFGANNKWGTFPAFSAGWNIANEDFMKGLKFDQLKLRAGYGVTGNQNIPSYISLVQYNPTGTFYYNGQNTTGYGPTQNANPDLKWETKTEINIGLDWAILNNRIGGAFDFYTRKTNDLLGQYNVPVPPNIASTTWANAMSMQNNGFEISIKTLPVKTQKFEWSLDVSLEYRISKLLKLQSQYYSLKYQNIGDVGAPGISAWTHRLEQGKPLGNIDGYVCQGIDASGHWMFRDYNPSADTTGGTPRDGKIDNNDRVVIGNGIPKYYLGFNNNFQYGRWGLSIMCRGMFDYQIINSKRIWNENPTFLPRNILKSAMNLTLLDSPDFSSYYVENGDFLKVDNITLSYIMPFKNSKWIKNGKVFITGTNLLVITGYKGNDPEVSFGSLTPGIDSRYGYPSTRSYTIGINLIF